MGGMQRSQPSTGNEGESRQDPDVKRNSSTAEEVERDPMTNNSQELPRKYHASRTASPAVTAPALSRQSSAFSTMTATPTTEEAPERRPTPPVQTPDPPVTKATLSELDALKIIHNPKLRHDINFDPDLHFRPNLDGEKGRRKHQKAEMFWQTLRNDLTMFLMDRPRFDREHSGNNWTLPMLLQAAKEIMQTLVPSRDRAVLDEGLNVELFMQQFYRGVADLEKLASWLRGILKSHCAPMRDEFVDMVYTQLSNGNANNDLDELVRGMQSLLNVLEAMKLDVANHQIRCLRPALIEDTVSFEQKLFHRRITSRRMNTDNVKTWYERAVQQYGDDDFHSVRDFGDMGVFFEAIATRLLPRSCNEHFPQTFHFDEERMARLRNDMFDAVFIEGCLRQYERLDGVYHMFQDANQSRPASQDGDSSSDSFLPGYLQYNTSRPNSQEFLSPCQSADPSPRSSLVIPAPTSVPAYVGSPQPDISTKRRNLHRALVDIMQSAPPGTAQMDRWRAVGPAMALEVFRASGLPLNLLSEVEDQIVNKLLRMDGPDYQDLEQQMFERLMGRLAERVNRYKGLSATSLFATATGELHTDPYEAAGESGLEDIATKLAHVGIVHWRVWAELVYLDSQGPQ